MDNRLRIPEERLRRFWSSMIHVVRNAVDHGIETPTQRRAKGKPATARLELISRKVNGYLEIEVADDGSGINWQQVRKAAQQKGLPHTTDADLTEALFCDGLSTRDSATDISGRGVGLSAVRSECEKIGGKISIQSQADVGTRFTFRFPIANLADSEPADVTNAAFGLPTASNR